MNQISILYAMSLFVVKRVKCFRKKRVQDGKYIFATSTESLKSQYKIFLKTVLIFNYNQFPSFD